MNTRTFPGIFPQRPAYSPDEEDGGEEFVEQPGDREPEPDAGDPPAEEAAAELSEDETPEGEEGGAAEGDGEGEEGDPPPAEAAAEGEEPPAEEEAAPAARKPNWKDRQIVKLRQQMKDKDTELARLRGGGGTEAAPEGGASTVGGGEGSDLVPRAQARQEALQEFRVEERNKKLNSALDGMFEAGAKTFPKTWGAQVAEAADALGAEMAQRPDFLETLTDLPNAAAVYNELSSDLDRLEEMLNMTPAKMGAELALISTRLATPPKPKPVTRTPAPIRPLQVHNDDELSLDDPNISQDEFNRRMDKIEAAAAADRRR